MSKPQVYRENGKLYLRHFLLSANHFNNQLWRVERIEDFLKTWPGHPLIMTPGYNHIFDSNRETWLKIQEPYTVGIGVDSVYNNKYGCYDSITEITNPRFEKALEEGLIPQFNSPGVFASQMREETDKEGRLIRVFEKGEIMHSAVVLSPAFRPKEMATINATGCRGEAAMCRNKLAAIASDKELETDPYELTKNYFRAYIRGDQKTSVKQMGDKDTESGDSKVVNTLLDKLQTDVKDKNLALEKANARIAELEKSEKSASEKETLVTKDRDDLKKKFEDIDKAKQAEEMKKKFDAKLKTVKMYNKDDEARSKKVDEFISKDIKLEDLDSIYEGMILSEDELKADVAKTPEPTGDKRVGIASSMVTTKKGNQIHAFGAAVLDEILEL